MKGMIMTYITLNVAWGPNQFAYVPGKGARDAVCFMVLTWLRAFNARRKIGIYCSDVSGAFDRVDGVRLLTKLKAMGLPAQIMNMVKKWLRERKARVIVGGASSGECPLRDMVYQGTVLGPILWDLFFADARIPIRDAKFEEIIYADDLNAMREYSASVAGDTILRDCKRCQKNLHQWGEANRVS